MEDTLIAVHVIFRHGNRTPDKFGLYSKDPHREVDFHPYGHGQLTNDGKKRAYQLGEVLRGDYNKFLGDLYVPEHVHPFSSHFDRTKMTLQLVLASLFPPKSDQIWNESLQWQPIPYTYSKHEDDNLFLSILSNSFSEVYDEYMKEEGKRVLDNNSSVIKHIEEHTGLVVSNTRALLHLTCTLQTQMEYGLKIPDWTKQIFPSVLEELSTYEYDALTGTTQLKSLMCGKLIEKILKDSQSKMEANTSGKMYLYSGHEINVAALLRCLGIYIRHIPPYCSNVRLEFHRIDGVYGFKVYYQKNIDEKPELLKLLNDEVFSPLEQFVELVEDVLIETQKI